MINLLLDSKKNKGN